MKWIDTLFLVSMISIWILLISNIILLYFGYRFSEDVRKAQSRQLEPYERYPFVSIMIPAHNEGIVIYKTLKAMVKLDYPIDSYEIIVVNDNSSDNTGEMIETVRSEHKHHTIKHIEVIGEMGGKGKSNALNIGFGHANGEYIAIYDADNTPNQMALRRLVHKLHSNDLFGAVIGKFRTRNKKKNLLTKFINIETLSFQWMAQAGRWKLFGLCTIPGTNFIIRRSIVEKIGGWDPDAIAEDTEISFRIYQMGYRIAFEPLAETYEQEPETVPVWVKQRSRWVNGNIYVLLKNVMNFRTMNSVSVLFDLFYFFSVYVLFLSSIIISDIIFLLGMFTDIKIQITGNYFVIWLLSYMVFLLQLSITLSIEKGEATKENILLAGLMYFTYCQMWLYVSIVSMSKFVKTTVMGKKHKWYKTERF